MAERAGMQRLASSARLASYASATGLSRFPLLAPLRGRDYAYLWGGNAVSLAGDQFQMVALAALVLERTGNTAVLGAVLGAQAVPRALLLLVGGVAADRFAPRTVMLGANLLQGLLVAALVGALATGRFDVWQLYLYAVTSGAALAFSQPAAQALVPTLVPRERLRSANALNALNTNLSSSVFAPLAGLVVARMGSIPAFAFNAVSFLVAASAVRAIRVPGAAAGDGGKRSGNPLAELWEGIMMARADRAVWAAIVAAALFSLGYGGATLVGVPALALLALNGGSEGVGLLLGALGTGAVLGNIVTGSLARLPRPGFVAGASLLAWGIALALAGATPSVAAAVPVLLVVGLLRGICGNTFVSLVQGRAPAAARGRIMALFFFGVNGLGPVSLAAGGLLGEVFGARALVASGGAVVALAGAYALAHREFRQAT
jgi:MFS family permease